MSWRETLGVAPSAGTSYAHNPQNTQKPAVPPNCADIADSAYRVSEEEGSKLLEALADACRGLDIAPADVVEALAAEDIEDWRRGAINGEALAAVRPVTGAAAADGSGQTSRSLHRASHLQTLRANLVVVFRRGAGLPLVLEPGGRPADTAPQNRPLWQLRAL